METKVTPQISIQKKPFYLALIFIFILVAFSTWNGGHIRYAIYCLFNPDEVPFMDSRGLVMKIGLLYFITELGILLYVINLLRRVIGLNPIMALNIVAIIGLLAFIYMFLPIHECYAGVKHILSETENHYH